MKKKRNPVWLRNIREGGLVYGLGALLIALAFWVTFQFIEPAPPRSLSIATGSPDGAYYRFANALRREMAVHGVTLVVRESNGSVENLALLSDGEVETAFIQSGLARAEDHPNLQSLGAMYYEPFWLFVRSGESITRLNELDGLTVAVGGVGSGTRLVAERLLQYNGLTTQQVTLSKLGGLDAVTALDNGEVDALLSVASIDAPMMRTLLSKTNVVPVSLSRAAAYARREPWLTQLTLPEGVVDLSKNLPPTDISLLAVNATLIASNNLHPALRDLLLQSADAVFSGSTLLSAKDEFPRAVGGDFQVLNTTERYYESGPPFLQRYLPFWVANLVDRLKILALPLIALMLPLSRMLPPAYRWTVRRKIYRWYDQVQEIDQQIDDKDSENHVISNLERLQSIEREVREVEVPLSYAHELYTLRLHIDLLEKQLQQRVRTLTTDSSTVP